MYRPRLAATAPLGALVNGFLTINSRSTASANMAFACGTCFRFVASAPLSAANQSRTLFRLTVSSGAPSPKYPRRSVPVCQYSSGLYIVMRDQHVEKAEFKGA